MAKKAVSRTTTTKTTAAVVAPDPPPKPKRWKMPQPQRGQAILFYAGNTRSKKNSEIGFVSSVGESSIMVVSRGIGYDEVLHIDDPRIKANPDLRKDIHGVWDFTDEHRANQELIQQIERRLEALEAATALY